MPPFLFLVTVQMDTISHRYRLVSATLQSVTSLRVNYCFGLYDVFHV